MCHHELSKYVKTNKKTETNFLQEKVNRVLKERSIKKLGNEQKCLLVIFVSLVSTCFWAWPFIIIQSSLSTQESLQGLHAQ